MESYGLVCDSVQNLIKAIATELPKIEKLIESGKIGLKDFEFMKYNGCEIVP